MEEVKKAGCSEERIFQTDGEVGKAWRCESK